MWKKDELHDVVDKTKENKVQEREKQIKTHRIIDKVFS